MGWKLARIALLGLLSATAVGLARAQDLASLEQADRVLVLKSKRKLYLMKDGKRLREMDIALGLVPTGHKQQSGDFRTPEGLYYLDARNPDSDYFLSIHVSYPNQQDRIRASELGVDPGGQIMIHGLPNEPNQDERSYSGWDWTDGCIAVSNSDMIDIWLMTGDSTPIEILP
jgi:murein L,D-transpeptidase YafK